MISVFFCRVLTKTEAKALIPTNLQVRNRESPKYKKHDTVREKYGLDDHVVVLARATCEIV